jgi:hypothetical protein
MRSLGTLAMLVLAAVTAFAASSSPAATISFELPQLNGMLTYGAEPVSASFDAGMRFSSIASVEIELTGRGENGTLRIISPDNTRETSFAPPLGVALPKQSGVYPSSWTQAAPNAWRTEFGAPHSTYIAGYFDHLLDGQGEIMLYSSDAFVTTGFDELEIVEPSQIEITEAAITIIGTPAPEPASSALMLSALVSGASAARRCKRT